MERSEEMMVNDEKLKGSSSKFPLTLWEISAASGVVLAFVLGLLGVYLTMPASDYSFLKLPQTLEDLQILSGSALQHIALSCMLGWRKGLESAWHRVVLSAIFYVCMLSILFELISVVTATLYSNEPASTNGQGSLPKEHVAISHEKKNWTQFECLAVRQFKSNLSKRGHLESYTSDYTVQVLVGYCVVYIFMQTFMIPGTVFMSLLAGALFGVFRGLALVLFTATAGASSCYFLSKLIGRPLVFSLWPDKLTFFQAQVAKRRENLLNYMLFLRVTPTLPNTFINVASPIVDVPYHIFFLATFIGIMPAAYVTVRAGITLGELRSVGDLYDFHSIATLFLIGLVTVTPTLMSKNKSS